MGKFLTNILSGAAGILVLMPSQPVQQLKPEGLGSDLENLRADMQRIAGDFNIAIQHVEEDKISKAS